MLHPTIAATGAAESAWLRRTYRRWRSASRTVRRSTAQNDRSVVMSTKPRPGVRVVRAAAPAETTEDGAGSDADQLMPSPNKAAMLFADTKKTQQATTPALEGWELVRASVLKSPTKQQASVARLSPAKKIKEVVNLARGVIVDHGGTAKPGLLKREAVVEHLRSHICHAAWRIDGEDWMRVFERYDTDRNGLIDVEEFTRKCRTNLRLTRKQISDDDIRVAFNVIDTDGSGAIDMRELISFLAGEEYATDAAAQEAAEVGCCGCGAVLASSLPV